MMHDTLQRRGNGIVGDQGMSLVAVIAVTAIIATVVIAGTAVALSSNRLGRHTADWSAALAAAYAGVEDYRSNLTNEPDYWRYGDPTAPFTIASGSSAVVLPPVPNPAFGLGAAGTWATVRGSDAKFRYEVDTSTYLTNGLIRVRATGAVGDETRSVVASITQDGFIKFLYWTDYEVSSVFVDQTACKANNWDTVHNRLKYAWEGRDKDQCGVIQFSQRDVIDGPMYTNDHPTICGGKFNDVVYTMTPKNPKYELPAGCSKPSFAVPDSPTSPDVRIDLPPTNAEMKRETRYDLGTSPGCLYTGPTSITFTSDGYMQVRSPWTKFTQTAGAGSTSGLNPSRCGTPGTAAGQLASSGGAKVPVVEGNLVFVQSVPTATTDVNYSPQTPEAVRCTTNGLGYPASNESAPAGTYGCTVGDVFVSGVVRGHMTVASENNLWVVGDITYAGSDDVLGLVGQKAVMVWHPVRSNDTNVLPGTNRTINAAILSVAGTFQVQNYDRGTPTGVLDVHGSIAQKYRGPVGASYTDGVIAHGYDKSYHYDSRFKTISPPKFLKATAITFQTSQIAEVSAAFDATGVDR
ncbi:MAG: hypothetical protein FWF02_04815 [Micrococcales bacterium]|nr:hypothetical protein [Micrococcales bacterium]MCL2667014.1 hypothetical protein [Micrococcales bacterium]